MAKRILTVTETKPDGTEHTYEVEMTGDLLKSADALKEAANKVTWCSCHEADQLPTYVEAPGYHGWDCARCGGLIQTG